MSPLEQLLEQVESKVGDLAEKTERQKNELHAVKEERDELANRIEQYKDKVAKLEEEREVLTVARAIDHGEGEDTKAVKGKINELVREIDKCIALLNR